jgi:hypothetical protein
VNAIAALLAVAGALTAAPAGPAAPPEPIEIRGAELRLADLAALDGFGFLARAPQQSLTVAALPTGRSRIVTSRGALADLVRRRLGAVVPHIDRVEGRVVISRGASAREDAGCFVAAAGIAPGATIVAADLEAAPCVPGGSQAALRFDRAGGLVRAVGRIGQGAYLGRLALPPEAAIAPGAELTLVSRVGPVRISRPVVALQVGRPGGRLFVRDREGSVFSVPLAGEPGPAR